MSRFGTCDWQGCRNPASELSPTKTRCWIPAHWRRELANYTGPIPGALPNPVGMGYALVPPQGADLAELSPDAARAAIPAAVAAWTAASSRKETWEPWQRAAADGKFRWEGPTKNPIARSCQVTRISADLGGFRLGVYHSASGFQDLYLVARVPGGTWLKVPLGTSCTKSNTRTGEKARGWLAHQGRDGVRALLATYAAAERASAEASTSDYSRGRSEGIARRAEAAAWLADPGLDPRVRQVALTLTEQGWAGDFAQLRMVAETTATN